MFMQTTLAPIAPGAKAPAKPFKAPEIGGQMSMLREALEQTRHEVIPTPKALDGRASYLWAVAYEVAQREHRGVCLLAKHSVFLTERRDALK